MRKQEVYYFTCGLIIAANGIFDYNFNKLVDTIDGEIKPTSSYVAKRNNKLLIFSKKDGEVDHLDSSMNIKDGVDLLNISCEFKNITEYKYVLIKSTLFRQPDNVLRYYNDLNVDDRDILLQKIRLSKFITFAQLVTDLFCDISYSIISLQYIDLLNYKLIV